MLFSLEIACFFRATYLPNPSLTLKNKTSKNKVDAGSKQSSYWLSLSPLTDDVQLSIDSRSLSVLDCTISGQISHTQCARLDTCLFWFLHGFHVHHENGSDVFFQNVMLSPSYTVLQHRMFKDYRILRSWWQRNRTEFSLAYFHL
jgi:hypothetical protein